MNLEALRSRYGGRGTTAAKTGDRVLVVVDGKKRRGRVEEETLVDGVRTLRITLDPIGAPAIEDEVEEAEGTPEEATITVPAAEAKRLVRRTARAL